MVKIIKYVMVFIAICLLGYWMGSFMKCEVLTKKYGHQFEAFTDAVGPTEIRYCKVLNYNKRLFAEVYYVEKDREFGYIKVFIFKHDRWVPIGWDAVWSRTGSADGFVWPYIR